MPEYGNENHCDEWDETKQSSQQIVTWHAEQASQGKKMKPDNDEVERHDEPPLVCSEAGYAYDCARERFSSDNDAKLPTDSAPLGRLVGQAGHEERRSNYANTEGDQAERSK